jgi:PAS domain S-box-containing protein
MSLPVEFLALRERFIARLPERLAAVAKALAELGAGNTAALPEIRRVMHSLVGAAGLHGMSELAAQASRIETLAEHGAAFSEIAAAVDHLALLIAPASTAPREKKMAHPCSADIALLFDSQDEMRSQAALLQGSGYRVTAYTDCAALEADLRSGKAFDLLLMGLLFGGDDQAGVAYLQRLQQLPFAAPVVVVSASRSIQYRLAAHKAGAASVLFKPLSAHGLLRRVEETLAGDAEEELALLAIAIEPGSLDAFARLAAGPRLCIDTCNAIDELRPTLGQRRYNALLLQDNPQDEATTTSLIALLHDDPDTVHLPMLLFSNRVDCARQARALAAGCKAIVDPGWQYTELNALLQALCTAASRRRVEVDSTQVKTYEFARQGEALDKHAIISLADHAANVFETSPQHSALTGYARTELIGANLVRPRAGFAPPELTAAILDEVKDGNIWQGEYALAGKHGDVCWVSSTLVPFLDTAGKVYQYMVIRSDITQRKHSEQGLARARASQLSIAAQIQETLLLPPLPGCPAGIPLASMFTAAEGVAGDFHALIIHNADCFDLLVGDVMGKGIAAALVGAAVKMEYASCLRELEQQNVGRLAEPAEIVAALRQRLTPKLIELECFVTLSYLRFDRRKRVLTSVGCGHPEIIIISTAGAISLPNQQLPLGLVEVEQPCQTETPWDPGAVVLLYSDGLSEATAADGAMLEAEALVRIAQEAHAAGRHPATITAAVLQAVNAFTGGQQPQDDRSLVVVRLPLDGETCLELDNSLQALQGLQDALQQALVADLAPEEFDRLMLACVEAFSNIVRHANSPSPRIALQIRLEPAGARVSFSYPGTPFTPPVQTSLPEPEQLGEGGLGLILIQTLCDHLEYRHDNGFNDIHLEIRRSERHSGTTVLQPTL